MKRSRNAGTVNVMAKLEQSVADGDYYHALQMYQTQVSRRAKRSDFASASKLGVSGSICMLRHGQDAGGCELALAVARVWQEVSFVFGLCTYMLVSSLCNFQFLEQASCERRASVAS